MSPLLSFLTGKDRAAEAEARDRAILERLEALERGQKGVKLEWEETFERLDRLLGRLNAHLKRSRSHDEEETQGEIAPPPAKAAASQAELLRAHRARRFGGLLHG